MATRSTAAVVLVVGLVLLSGCSAILDGGNGNGVGDGNGDGDAPADPSEFDYADGYGPDGVTDGEAAVDSHESTLIDRGSYTGSYTYDINRSDQQILVDVTNRVDFASERALQEVDVDDPRYTAEYDVYRNGTHRLERTVFDNQTSYDSEERAFVAEDLTVIDPIRPLLTNVSDYEASIEQRDGESVVVYSRSDAEGIDSFVGINESATISAFDGSVAVDSDGVVRSASYSITYTVDGEERSLDVEYSLSAFGETTVERPSWAADA